MRTILKLGAIASILSGLALAETWNGRLLDASCTEPQKTACDATGTTTSFVLFVADKAYKLDDAGNAKAVEALKNRADRAKEPSGSAQAGAQVIAKVSGTLEGEILKVDVIQVQ